MAKKSSGTDDFSSKTHFTHKFAPGDVVKHIDERYAINFGKRGYVTMVAEKGSLFGYYMVQFEGDFIGNSKGCWERSLVHCPPVQFILC